MKNAKILFIAAFIISAAELTGQTLISGDLMQFYTAQWDGERLQDGRPNVPEELITRLKNLSIEEIWGTLRNEGYNNQFESGWQMVREDETIAGRVLTALYYPKRPDVEKSIIDKGLASGNKGGANSWPIDMLKEGDVYVADCFGKIVDGTLIGDNLGNSIFAKSHRGVIFDAGARDLEGLLEIKGFNAFVRGFDPSFLQETMLMGINVPIRIGKAVVFPGDVVVAKKEGVIFVPPHMVKKVVLSGEFVMLRDKFGHQMLREGRFSPGQIDAQWSTEIKDAFMAWIEKNPKEMPMTRKELDEFLKDRTW
jgi:4-hydroxy-4-methyl-2-oxoglutarate aldolase